MVLRRSGVASWILATLALFPAVCPAQDRTQLPLFLQDSYFGIDFGYGAFGFSNANLAPGFAATTIQNDRATIRISAGHYFEPFLAVQLTLMRPILWIQYDGVYSPRSSNSVWLTYLALTARPMLSLGDRLKLFAEAGPAYYSRHGFTGPTGTGVPDATGFTALTGGGLLYRLGSHWEVDASAGFVWAVRDQPSTVYGAVGLAYRFEARPPPAGEPRASSEWTAHELDVGFFERGAIYWNISRGLSRAGLFFEGQIKTQRGESLFYQQNVYHGARWISLDWGASGARWVSAVDGETFYTISVFPALRVWFVRGSVVAGYLGLSVAGPSYLSRGTIDGKPTGGAFTFQDFLELGVLVGRTGRLKVALRLLHYSNGNLRPENPGIASPVTLNAGYAW